MHLAYQLWCRSEQKKIGFILLCQVGILPDLLFVLTKILLHLLIKLIVGIHHRNRNMQHIIQPLKQPEPHCFLCKKWVLLLHNLRNPVCIPYNIRKHGRKIIFIMRSGIASISIKYVIILLRQYGNPGYLRQHLHQQIKVLVQLSFRKPPVFKQGPVRQSCTKGAVATMKQQLPHNKLTIPDLRFLRWLTDIRKPVPPLINLIPRALYHQQILLLRCR